MKSRMHVHTYSVGALKRKLYFPPYFCTHFSNRKSDWSMKRHRNVLDRPHAAIAIDRDHKINARFAISIVHDHIFTCNYSPRRGRNNMASGFELRNLHLYGLTFVSERL